MKSNSNDSLRPFGSDPTRPGWPMWLLGGLYVLSLIFLTAMAVLDSLRR